MLRKVKTLSTQRIVAFFGAVTLTAAVLAPEAFAASCGTETNIISCGGSNPIWEIMLLVVNILAAGIGLVAVGGLVYGAILYTSAQNNSGQITKAKTTIFNTILGLICFALMYSFLQYLIPGGFINNLTNPTAIPAPRVSTPGNSGDCTCEDAGGDGVNGDGANESDGSTGNVTVADISIKNFRDASTTTGGSVLKSGVLYRSTRLSSIGPKKAQKLSKLLGADATIIDLQKSGEPADKPIGNIRNIRIPTQGFHDTSPAVTDPAIRKSIAQALRTAANSQGPVLVHCFSGKDRTGWTVAMIMFIAGASDAQIKKEYAKSTEAFPTHDPNWINSGLSLAKKNYGGKIGNYLRSDRGLGLSDAVIKKIRQKFKA
ncbi:MAG TPA: tyrosine-protein phosphatase [Candidatus Saccharimonadales bacterium]